MPSNARFTALREVLADVPSDQAWAELVSLLDAWPHDDGLALAIEYARAHLAQWPTFVRRAPDHWGFDNPRRPLAHFLDPHEELALRAEIEIVWDEELTALDYVRQVFVRAHHPLDPLPWRGEGRRVGYATLDPGLPPRLRSTRRVFVLRDYDRDTDPDGVYADSLPREAVDPRTVASGCLGVVTPRAERGVGAPDPERNPELDALHERWAGCTRCRLATQRTHLVLGAGPPRRPPVFLLTGPPAARDDAMGLPLMDANQRLLVRLLHRAGLRRSDVFITPVVKCVPGDRALPPEALVACRPLWEEQLRCVAPSLIVTLGELPLQEVVGGPSPLAQLRGRWLEHQGTPLFPTWGLDELAAPTAERQEAWGHWDTIGRWLAERR